MWKGFMYIDEDISMNFNMPDDLKEIIDNLDKAFNDNDYEAWNLYWEIVGIAAKNDHACGFITAEQMHAIWERYGTGG